MHLEILAYLNALRRHWGTLVTSGAFIGGLSIWQGSGHHVPPWVYWAVAIGGVLVASFLSWRDQYRAGVEAGKKFDESRPRLMLSVSSMPVAQWNHDTLGFFIQNYGPRPATFVSCDRASSAGGKFTLDLQPMQPEVLLPGMRPPLDFRVLRNPYIWSQHAEDISHTPKMLLEFLKDGNDGLFGRTITITIRFRDTDQRELLDKVLLDWDGEVAKILPHREPIKQHIKLVARIKAYVHTKTAP